MRATVEGVEIEGTPEEIAAFLRAQRQTQLFRKLVGLGDTPDDEDSSDNERFASERIAYRALRRRPLSSNQQKLFKHLSASHPSWETATSLQQALGLTPNQLGGLLGGIGRRLSTTDGYVKDSSMFEWMWHADHGEYAYRLPPSVQKAVLRFDP